MRLSTVGGFAGGLADGGLKGLQARADVDKNAREQAEAAQRLEEGALRLRQAKQLEQDQQALRDAAAPGTVDQPNDVLKDDDGNDMPAVGGYRLTQGSNVERFQTPEQAQQAAQAANTPAAIAARQAATLTAQGRPDTAIRLQRDQATLDKEREERVRTLKNEGYMDTARAMLVGDPKGVVEAFNKQGKMKIEGDLKVTPKEIDMPGLGKVPSYDYTGTVVDDKGNRQTLTVNSHQFAMSLLPYKDQLETMRKGVDTASKVEARLSQAEAAVSKAEAAGRTADAAAARAEVQRLKAEAAGQANSPEGVKAIAEQRKQATALMTDSTKNLTEVRRKMDSLRRSSPLGIKPGTPEAEDMERYKQEEQLHQQNYDEARQQLRDVGAPRGAAPSASPAAAPAPGRAPAPMPKTQAQLRAGIVYNTARGPARWNGTAFEAVK